MNRRYYSEIEIALALIELGDPIPLDLEASLIEQGVDVEGLQELCGSQPQ